MGYCRPRHKLTNALPGHWRSGSSSWRDWTYRKNAFRRTDVLACACGPDPGCAPFNTAHYLWRICGDASVEPGQRAARPGAYWHAGGHAQALPGSAGTQCRGWYFVTGPTGSGKTSTLYAALGEINAAELKVITVEDPVEYRLPGITQVQVNEKIELTFAKVLRATLRQDPDVILVGEMRDAETAEIGLRAAITGHLVLSTLHTRDAVSTPFRLLDMGIPPFMVATSLQAVIAQRLVRLNCEICAEPQAPSAQEQEWLTGMVGVGEAVNPKRGRGCSACNGTGYTGRQGVYELLEMDTVLTHAASKGDPAAFLKAARERMKGHTLAFHALELVRQGRTSLAEALRVGFDVDDQYDEARWLPRKSGRTNRWLRTPGGGAIPGVNWLKESWRP